MFQGLSGRSIPARAGEPGLLGAAGVNHPVYPRACGGTRCSGFHFTHIAGLSPRVRGNRLVRAVTMAVVRSIPARAGEPQAINHASVAVTVYPRACGGTTAHSPPGKVGYGLSPRVRGNRLDPI